MTPVARCAPPFGSFLLFFALAAFAGLAVGPSWAQAVKPSRPAPEIGGGLWINSAPLTMAGLRGRVALVEFWTYG